MTLCCPCDELLHPPKPDIPAGLSTLPRQLAAFPEYRLAMLRAIPMHAPLSEWRAREGDDLGLMVLEMWAYVLDTLGFYDERIANETYLRTATQRSSSRKLVGLIGYQPRPALAASVVLAAIADGQQPVTIPPRTGFRSDAFDGEAPQLFETETQTIIHPLKNQWRLGPVRDKTIGTRILLDVRTARLTRDQLVLFVWTKTGSTAAPKAVVGRVQGTAAIEGRDGQTYIEVEVSPPPEFDADLTFDEVQVLSPSLTASVSPFVPSTSENKETVIENVDGNTCLFLDAIYRPIKQGDLIVVRRRDAFLAVEVMKASIGSVVVPAPSTIEAPVTRIDVFPQLEQAWQDEPDALTIHFNLIDGGRLTRVAKTELNRPDFDPDGIPTEGTLEPVPAPIPSELLLQDAHANGVHVGGSVDIDESGNGKVTLKADVPAFETVLRTPVTAFGNLVPATRGESVFNEVLGRGDASQSFQSFTLRKSPLTYINDPAAPNGRRTTLEIRVNGITWKEVPSFFGTAPAAEVYIVRQNDAGQTVVTFGDGTTGSRLPTGIGNVSATYRFGAGAAKPPAAAISQLAKPVAGLRRVLSPIAAGGGADADQPQDIRTNAPNSALLLGRAVSPQDFEALAREFGGVINANVEWTWDETCQGAVVKVWFIADGGDIKKDLEAFLIGQADPNAPLVAEAAQAVFSELIIDLDVDPRFNSTTVIEHVKQALTDSAGGILALKNIPIGRAIFRSQIFDAVLAIEGALSVRAMTVNGKPAPPVIPTKPGRYHNFLDALTIGNTAVGDQLFTAADNGG
jgi:hypothetical protein